MILNPSAPPQVQVCMGHPGLNGKVARKFACATLVFPTLSQNHLSIIQQVTMALRVTLRGMLVCPRVSTPITPEDLVTDRQFLFQGRWKDQTRR